MALPVEEEGQAGRRSGTTPRAPAVTRQVSRGRETEGLTGLLSVHSQLRNWAIRPVLWVRAGDMRRRREMERAVVGLRCR